MILIDKGKGEEIIIPAEKLVTKAQYAKSYKKEDGSVGCQPAYIKYLVDTGKLKSIKISGVEFIIDERNEEPSKD